MLSIFIWSSIFFNLFLLLITLTFCPQCSLQPPLKILCAYKLEIFVSNKIKTIFRLITWKHIFHRLVTFTLALYLYSYLWLPKTISLDSIYIIILIIEVYFLKVQKAWVLVIGNLFFLDISQAFFSSSLTVCWFLIIYQ